MERFARRLHSGKTIGGTLTLIRTGGCLNEEKAAKEIICRVLVYISEARRKGRLDIREGFSPLPQKSLLASNGEVSVQVGVVWKCLLTSANVFWQNEEL